MGATIGTVLLPSSLSRRTRVVALGAMMFLANLPDLPVSGWGHDRYQVSHSLFVGLLLVGGYAFIGRCSPLRQTFYGSWAFISAGSLALYSHYLLDSFYNHGKGIAIYWPYSDARLALPIPWFSVMQLDPLFCWSNFRTWGIEFLCYGSLLAMVLAARIAWQKTTQNQATPS